MVAEGYRFAQTILNSISAHVAILDEEGFILETNKAWKLFARQNDLSVRPDELRVNYLDICDGAVETTHGETALVARGIRAVIAGEMDEFVMDYPCHSPLEKRWFYMRVTRADGPGPVRIVVSHENITALKLAQERLEESNTALKVLLRRREADRKEMEMNVVENLHQLVRPILSRLRERNLPEGERALLATLETRLDEITKPFLQRLQAVEKTLTPQEIEVAALIREGLTSKEIAGRLNLSVTTIQFHRRNLRRKLNLRNTDANLCSFLNTLLD